MIKILLILIIFILILLIRENSYIKIELITNNNLGYLMNKDELYSFLINDYDNYYKNFSSKDLKARKINNIEEYYSKIKESCIDIDYKQSLILNKCIKNANEKLIKYSCIGFDGIKCANIVWTIGLIKDNLYEEGFPHTRKNLIVIPLYSLKNPSQLTNTLIHEKIHVYQKMFPEDINEYLVNNGFTKYKLRNNFNNTRSNPDMDEWIYKNKNDEIMMAEYYENPKSIMDVNIIPNNNSKYEHPFEYMAYDITNDINNL